MGFQHDGAILGGGREPGVIGPIINIFYSCAFKKNYDCRQ